MTSQTRPTRPRRPPREVVSFVRRSTRMRGAQQRAWDEQRDRYLVPVVRVDLSTSVAPQPPLDVRQLFGRPGPLLVEIGPGGGEALVAEARRRPEINVLAFEVHQPSLAQAVKQLSDAGLDHVRLVEADAVAGLRELLAPASVDELWTYFPDPWPKARHHKRRLVDRAFADLAVSRLRAGGSWRLATDWADYADQMRVVLDGHPDLVADPTADRTRIRTRFEHRGLTAGREITDLVYRRR